MDTYNPLDDDFHIDNIVDRKASELSLEAFLFRKGPVYSPSLTSLNNQIKLFLNFMKDIKAKELSIHNDVLGNYCTVLLEENPDNTIVIDEHGNKILGISSAYLNYAFSDICNALSFDRVKTYCIAGKLLPISLFNSKPIYNNSYIDRFYVNNSNSNYLVYNAFGFGEIFNTSELINSINFNDYIKSKMLSTNNLVNVTSYEEHHNNNVFDSILLSNLHRKYVYIHNKIGSSLRECYKINEMSHFGFYPYEFLYTIGIDGDINPFEHKAEVEEYIRHILDNESYSVNTENDYDHVSAFIYDKCNNFNYNHAHETPVQGVIIRQKDVDSYNKSIMLGATINPYNILIKRPKYVDNKDLSYKYSNVLIKYHSFNNKCSKILAHMSHMNYNKYSVKNNDTLYNELKHLCKISNEIENLFI